MASIEGWSLAWSDAEEEARSAADIAAYVESYSAILFRVVHSVLRSRVEAEDVVQDVFLRVLTHRSALPAVRDMRVWLIRIAWNLALDRRRGIRPEQMDESFAMTLAAETVPADQQIEEARRLRAVLRAIERLPRRERHVLLLSAVDEMSVAEMAAVLRASESAVRALLFRARARLRERLEREEER